MNKLIIAAAVGVVVIGGVAFYGGTKVGAHRSQQGRIGQFANRQGGMGGGARGGMGAVTGEIISRDDKGFTVKLQDGGSKLVFVSDSTVVSKTASGSLDDLKAGTQVFVTGTANEDGSTTANMVRIGGGFGAGFGGGARPTPQQ